MFKVLVLAVLGIGAVMPAVGADISTTEQAKALAADVMQLIVKGQVKEAIALLKPNWPLPDTEMDMLALQITNQHDVVSNRFGSVVGFEFVHERHAGDFLYEVSYAEKHQRHFLHWQFYFYKADRVWLVNSVKFDDSVAPLLSP